jgi:hypothetical protein
MGKCRTCGEGQAHCLLRYLAALLCTCDPSRCNPSPAPSPPLPPSPLPPPPLPTPVGAKHVLFMVVDDMRPMMRRAYNFSLAVTPHMDQLASEGLTFTRAYCNYAICSPSRNSFMSGRRPDTTRVWEFKDSFRQGGGLGWTSLPEWYKRHGYLTLGSGKLFHVCSRQLCPPPPPSISAVFHSAQAALETRQPSTTSNQNNAGMPSNDWPRSWSPEWPYFANAASGQLPQCVAPACHCRNNDTKQYCIALLDKDASVLQDQKIRDSCISHLHLAKNETARSASRYFGKPFFLGCGLHKPHVRAEPRLCIPTHPMRFRLGTCFECLTSEHRVSYSAPPQVPWHAPEEFYDMYPPAAQIPLPPPALRSVPQGAPLVAWHEPENVDFKTAYNVSCAPFSIATMRTTLRLFGAKLHGVVWGPLLLRVARHRRRQLTSCFATTQRRPAHRQALPPCVLCIHLLPGLQHWAGARHAGDAGLLRQHRGCPLRRSRATGYPAG